MEERQWSGRTDGSQRMQSWLIATARWMPRLMLYTGLAFVVPFYYLLSHRSRRAIRRFRRDVRAAGGRRTALGAMGNFYAFGLAIVDRFLLYAGRRFRISVVGNDAFSRLAEGREGVVVLSAHTGNFELCGYCLHSTRKAVNALVFGGETAVVNANRARLLSGNDVTLIPVADDLSHLFAVNAALERGEIVCLTADRVFGSQKTLSLPFLGREARFPMGPFILAVQRRVPVLTLFVMKQGIGRYEVGVRDVSLTADEQALPLRRQAALLAEKYVGVLEENVRRRPSQWFNFFDFRAQ